MSMWARIIDILLPPRKSEVFVRGATHEIVLELLQPVAIVGTQATTTLLPYRESLVQALIQEAKYHSNKKAWALLGAVLSEYLLEQVAEDSAFSLFVLVPIPLSKKRRKTRGYNQVEEVCAYATERLGESIQLKPHLLERVRETLPQTKLSKEARMKNVSGAFRANQELDAHTTYILIDDVFTTGATIYSAYDALTKGGAKRILLLTLAH